MDDRFYAALFVQREMKLKLDTLSLEESNEFMDIKRVLASVDAVNRFGICCRCTCCCRRLRCSCAPRRLLPARHAATVDGRASYTRSWTACAVTAPRLARFCGRPLTCSWNKSCSRMKDADEDDVSAGDDDPHKRSPLHTG